MKKIKWETDECGFSEAIVGSLTLCCSPVYPTCGHRYWMVYVFCGKDDERVSFGIRHDTLENAQNDAINVAKTVVLNKKEQLIEEMSMLGMEF